MKARASIPVKILLLAFLNLVLLAVVFGVFVRLQFRLDPGSFLLAPARDRILSVSRLIALEFPDSRPEAWNQLLDRSAQTYPARFFLFTNQGRQIAGDSVAVPAPLLEWICRDHMEFFDKRGQSPPPPRFDFPSGPPFFLTRSGNPSLYWAGVHVPIPLANNSKTATIRLRLLASSATFARISSASRWPNSITRFRKFRRNCDRSYFLRCTWF
jgi:hypothetical protein